MSHDTTAATDRRSFGHISNLRTRALLEAVPVGGSILDIGCVQHDAAAEHSNEWVHKYLYEIGDEVLGLDYLEDDVETLTDRGYDAVCADAQNFDLDRTFDTIVAGEIIEHLADLGGFLESVHRHLAPDGTFVLSTPNAWTFHRFRQALLRQDVSCNPEHICWFDERTIRQLLARHGFAIDRLEYVRPTEPGLSRLLYDLGRETIGGASLLVTASSGE
ncbi:class I SAM-dependent methyltransferase [Halomarina halobia]|uniref:Class I SAM-dependent methyltransferase n=1 Tax=Halomarina halobia TaxID=3033386 RepID=A0ABD6A5J8_9EURY|nr:class I SAM-dependent methyltransferase [Halomarina sp. PSR21]